MVRDVSSETDINSRTNILGELIVGKSKTQSFETIPDREYWEWVDKAEYLIRYNYVDPSEDPVALARRMYNKRNVL